MNKVIPRDSYEPGHDGGEAVAVSLTCGPCPARVNLRRRTRCLGDLVCRHSHPRAMPVRFRANREQLNTF